MYDEVSQLSLEEFQNRVAVISGQAAENLRHTFISMFVDTGHPSYQDYIDTPEHLSRVAAPWLSGREIEGSSQKPDNEGHYYWGYLWDFLKNKHRIIEGDVVGAAGPETTVYAMWDVHSPRKIPGNPDYWKFPVSAILRLQFRDLLQGLAHLPEDIYIFDDTFSWALVLTHEYDDQGNRFVLVAGQVPGESHATTRRP